MVGRLDCWMVVDERGTRHAVLSHTISCQYCLLHVMRTLSNSEIAIGLQTPGRPKDSVHLQAQPSDV